jgi:6-phosphogluconate dehydrogenase
VFRSWREGTVIRSWLLDLLVAALDEAPNLKGIAGYAEDSGEGRWTVEAAIDNAVPLSAITSSLFARFASRQEVSPAMQAVAAMRNQFGGHAMRTDAPPTGEEGAAKHPEDTGKPEQSGAAEEAESDRSTAGES